MVEMVDAERADEADEDVAPDVERTMHGVDDEFFAAHRTGSFAAQRADQAKAGEHPGKE